MAGARVQENKTQRQPGIHAPSQAALQAGKDINTLQSGYAGVYVDEGMAEIPPTE
jgi:hypothetical protein